MNKVEIINAVAEKLDITKKAASDTVDTVVTTMLEAIHKGGFSYPGLGKFVIKTRAARTGRNPQNGKPVKIPERRTIGFKAAASLKKSLR